MKNAILTSFFRYVTDSDQDFQAVNAFFRYSRTFSKFYFEWSLQQSMRELSQKKAIEFKVEMLDMPHVSDFGSSNISFSHIQIGMCNFKLPWNS